jgi:hypothetical protein
VIAGLNLYVYVGNNPLKYIDPTGHVKKTPEQEAQEEQEAVEIRRRVLSLPAMMAVPP